MKRFSIAILAGLMTMLFVASAHAGSVTAYLSNVSPTGTVNVSFDSGSSYTDSPYVGEINWTNVTSNTGNTLVDNYLANGFSTFCIEGVQNVYIHQDATWTLTSLANGPNTSPMGADRAERVDEFWGRHIAQVTNSETAAAFQLGIWEIVNDSPFSHTGSYSASFTPNFGNGVFRANGDNPSGAISLASSWITDSVNGLGGSASYSDYNVYCLTSSTLQDQIFAIPVPVPAALPAGLACIGLLALAGLRRHRLA